MKQLRDLKKGDFLYSYYGLNAMPFSCVYKSEVVSVLTKDKITKIKVKRTTDTRNERRCNEYDGIQYAVGYYTGYYAVNDYHIFSTNEDEIERMIDTARRADKYNELVQARNNIAKFFFPDR